MIMRKSHFIRFSIYITAVLLLAAYACDGGTGPGNGDGTGNWVILGKKTPSSPYTFRAVNADTGVEVYRRQNNEGGLVFDLKIRQEGNEINLLLWGGLLAIYDQQGNELIRYDVENFYVDDFIIIEETTGCCWVAIERMGRCTKYNREGRGVYSLDLNKKPLDGDIYDADYSFCVLGTNSDEFTVYKVSSVGEIIFEKDLDFEEDHTTDNAYQLEINQSNGDIWVSGQKRVLVISSDGDNLRDISLETGDHVKDMKIDSETGDVWILADTGVFKMDSNGTVKVTRNDLSGDALTVNDEDGTVWVADPWENTIYRLDRDGNSTLSIEGRDEYVGTMYLD
jgi:hypothetical protein